MSVYKELELKDEFDIISINSSENSNDSDVLSICDRIEEIEYQNNFEEQLKSLVI